MDRPKHRPKPQQQQARVAVAFQAIAAAAASLFRFVTPRSADYRAKRAEEEAKSHSARWRMHYFGRLRNVELGPEAKAFREKKDRRRELVAARLDERRRRVIVYGRHPKAPRTPLQEACRILATRPPLLKDHTEATFAIARAADRAARKRARRLLRAAGGIVGA